MGREWLYWVGGGMGRPRSRRRTMKQDNNDRSTSAGCMCAVFQLFDLHHHLPLNHQHSLSPFLPQPQDTDDDTTFKGVEAPRNSLEMEEPPAAKQDENLNFPAGIQIKTKREDFSAESSIDSPGTKTPNLVARLMGLDLLPESSSPSFSCPNPSKSHLNQTKDRSSFYEDDINVGARSLPATPRISSARRSDVDYHHHRLSLQINKDNCNEEFAVSAKTTRPRFRQQQQQDENRSPGHYAKQILKQVKESVSKRVGRDITNTTRDRDETIRRDQNLLLKLSKKNSIAHDTKQSTTWPKLRILDTNTNKPPLAETPTKTPRNSVSSDANPSVSNPKHQPVNTPQHQETNKNIGKKLSPKNCDQAIRNKKEDAFVRSPAVNKVNLTDKKKSKKAPLSSELVHLSGPTILPVKKGPSPPATKLPQKQLQPQVSSSDALSSKRNTQLSSNTRRSYKLLPDKIFTVPEYVPDTTNGCTCATSAAADYRCYIHKILKRAGIVDKLIPLTLGKWHTPSHPLDPSIFYYLELFHPASAATVLSRRCNRKLIFQLVDEILADVLRPHLDYKPWISPAVGNAHHFGLVDDLCRKIESFPAVDCQVLEDIDFLIEKDLCKAAFNGYYEEEAERLVREIEAEIVERLVSETVADAEGQKRWMSRARDAINWESSTWTSHPRLYKVEMVGN